jgi:hypothetical protein
MRNRFFPCRAAPIAASFPVASLSACISSPAQRANAVKKDNRICERFGAPYGSDAHGKCMLEQQRRRDDNERRTLEKMRMTSEIAREGQIMSERARRDRCRRNPDRKECGL